MLDEVSFALENQRALRDCEEHYLSDSDDYIDDYDYNPPYDTTEEAYD